MPGKPIQSLICHLTVGLSVEEISAGTCKNVCFSEGALSVMGDLYRWQEKRCQYGKGTSTETIDLKKQIP
jgi:hypothetical protein